MASVSGRIALITGAGAGLGEAVARGLADLGWTLVVTDVSLEAAERVTRSLATSHRSYSLDVRSEAATEEVFDRVEGTLGPITAVVAAAGGPTNTKNHQPRLTELTLAEWDEALRLNLTSSMLTTRALLRRRRKLPLEHARIILFTSVGAMRAGAPTGSGYGCAKAAILALTREAALEGAPFGVTVNAIAPGAFDTPGFWAGTPADMAGDIANFTPLKRMGRPDEVAAAVAYLLSDQADFITGATLDITGGIHIR